MSILNNANYSVFPRAVLVIMNILRAIEANPAEMRLLCVAAVIYWELKTRVLLLLCTCCNIPRSLVYSHS